MKNIVKFLLISLVCLFSIGCAPKSFIKTSVAEWRTIQVRPGLDKNQVWDHLTDITAKTYDLEVINKDSGYIRSAWMYTLLGTINDRYRTRLVAKIKSDGKAIEIKTDAHWLMDGSWVAGYDTILLEQAYMDMQGMIGRVTR